MQTGLPMSALSVVGASWRLSAADREFLFTSYLPWALEAGSRSADLMSLYYERHWHVGTLCSSLAVHDLWLLVLMCHGSAVQT